jgi:adenylate cyclase
VMFGNVGLSDRLTFSAFGSAVNEAQRLQNLTKKYPNRLIASKEFATYCGGNGWVTLGREKLAGVKQKLTILSPDMTEAVLEEEDAGIEASFDRMSDAERLMLLRRDAEKPQRSVPDQRKLQ